MKIVAQRTNKMRLDSYIDDLKELGVPILRVELSNKEFVSIWNSIIGPSIDDSNILWTKTLVKNIPKSGSYFIYRGVCVQHHKDYPHGDLGVEYI